MTTPASADCGRSDSSELRNRSRTATRPAPTTPVSCVFAPDCSATAVREPLVEIANPWKNPAATLAVPMPIISWLGCSSSPRRAAKLDAVAMVSVSDTSTMPIAASRSGPTSSIDVHGNDGFGKPCGSVPTVATPSAARSSTADTIVAPATATRTAGIRGVMRGSTSSTTSTPTPTSTAPVWVASRCSKNVAQLVEEAVGVGGEAEQLRQLADDDRDGQAVHVADLHLAREQVGDEAELGDAQSDLDQADEQRQHPGQHDRLSRVVDHEQRRDGGEDQRRDRRVGPEHEHARRTEDGVRDEAGDRGVEPGDRRGARRAPRRPCPAARGSRRARGRRRGRRATTSAGTSGRRRPPGSIGRVTWPAQYAAASNSSMPPTGQGALPVQRGERTLSHAVGPSPHRPGPSRANRETVAQPALLRNGDVTNISLRTLRSKPRHAKNRPSRSPTGPSECSPVDTNSTRCGVPRGALTRVRSASGCVGMLRGHRRRYGSRKVTARRCLSRFELSARTIRSTTRSRTAVPGPTRCCQRCRRGSPRASSSSAHLPSRSTSSTTSAPSIASPQLPYTTVCSRGTEPGTPTSRRRDTPRSREKH